MSRIDVVHDIGVRFHADIRGHRVTFDQPVDAGGADAGPTPTEMFVASLGACVAYYAERFLERHDQATTGLAVRTTFAMGERPARVISIDVALVTPPRFRDDLRAPLQAVVEHCTVHNSLRLAPAVRIQIETPELVGLR